VLNDLCSFRDQSAYAEFVVFESDCPGSTCGDVDAKLTAGDTSGALFRAVVPTDQGLPAIGDLTARKYAFGVVLRDDSCRPVATGCTCASLDDIKKVEINVAAWANCTSASDCTQAQACTALDSPGCVAPAVCVAGKCEGEPGDAGTDATTDGGGGPCSLAVVAAGELPAPITDDASLSGPAITATDTGFVVGYREQDPTTTQLQLVLQGISDSGTPSTPSKLPVATCAVTPSDGIGMAFSGTQGVLVASLPDCASAGADAGASFAGFNSAGVGTGPNNQRNPLFMDLTLAPTHSLAAISSAPGDFEFVYRVKTTNGVAAQTGTLEGPAFKSGVFTKNLFSAASVGFVAVERTDQVRGVLAQLSDRAVVVLEVGPPDDTAVKEFELADKPWGALTAYGDRVVAMVPGGTGLSYIVTDSTGADLGSGSTGSGSVRGGDVVSLGDRVVFLAGGSGKLALHPFTGASSTLSAAAPVEYSGTLGSQSLSSFDGDMVAMDAARGQVAVAWVTRSRLVAGEPTGGWAILECKN